MGGGRKKGVTVVRRLFCRVTFPVYASLAFGVEVWVMWRFRHTEKPAENCAGAPRAPSKRTHAPTARRTRDGRLPARTPHSFRTDHTNLSRGTPRHGGCGIKKVQVPPLPPSPLRPVGARLLCGGLAVVRVVTPLAGVSAAGRRAFCARKRSRPCARGSPRLRPAPRIFLYFARVRSGAGSRSGA